MPIQPRGVVNPAASGHQLGRASLRPSRWGTEVGPHLSPPATWPQREEAQASFSLAIAALPGFPGDSVGKESACNIGDLSSIPGSGRSPAEGNGHPLQHSGLGKSQGQRSLAGYSPWGRKESDTTEQLNHHITTSFAQTAPSHPHCGRRGTMIRPIL